jgi:hypothetical protein
MKLSEILLEVGDTALTVDWYIDDGYTKMGNLTIGEDQYEIIFSGLESPLLDRPEVEVSFTNKDADYDEMHKMTNKHRNQFAVLSTVANELQKYIKDYNPYKIYALADKNDKSRNQVYARAFKRLAKQLGYQYGVDDAGTDNEHIVFDTSVLK